jgi:hypothetical protein
VTTAAVALALTWPAPVIVAECDPGGGDVLAGLLAGHVPASQGLMQVALEAGHDGRAAAGNLAAQLVPLDANNSRMLLPGLTDPRQAVGLAPVWPAVAATLTAQPTDVIADCGRLDAGAAQPLAIMSAARTVAIVLRPTLRQVWAARSRVETLKQLCGSNARLVLLLTGPGTYPVREISDALGVPAAAVLPDDSRTAALLSDGLGGRRQLVSGHLLRSAKTAGFKLRAHEAAAGQQPAGAGATR